MLRVSGGEDLVIALKNQAHLEIDDGRYKPAEVAAQEAVDVAVRTLGDQHPETVGALLMQAYVHQYSRNPAEALAASRAAYDRTLALYRDAPQHPRAIEGRLLYGRALWLAGEAAQAVKQLEQAVRDAAVVFGESSRMVGFFSLPLVESQIEAGHVLDAIETSRKAADIIGRHTKPRSFRHAAAVHHRGSALLAARRAEDALPDLTRSTDTLREILSTRSEVTRWFQGDLGLALARAGQPRQAQALIEAILPQTGDRSDPASTKALYAMGLAKRLAGEPAAALRWQRQALEAMKPDRSADFRRMRALTELGLTLLDLNRPAESVAPLERALAVAERLQTRTSPDRIDILVGLGRAKIALGQNEEARTLLQVADRFWREFDGRSSEARRAAFWLSRCGD
jgi:tetratricopeptide (TPR) repeat protein